jgi:hypothetical protein
MRLVIGPGMAALATLLLPGCATVIRGTSQKFVILSSPPEARVTLSTGQSCVTPCKLKLKRKRGFTATFTKPGFEPYRAAVKSRFSGGGAAATAGNVLLGGLIGAAVDGSSGALDDLTPNPLKVKLTESPAPAPADTAPRAPDPLAAPSSSPSRSDASRTRRTKRYPSSFDRAKAARKPATAIRPAKSWVPSNASGTIVSTIIARIAPAAIAWTDAIQAGSSPSKAT